MFVKICGTTNLEDAQLSAALGADALGFIFAPSKRRIAVETAAAIVQELPPDLLRVGVFTQPDAKGVAKAASEAGMSAVQMHWAYDPRFLDAFHGEFGNGLELWQVVGFEVEPQDREEAGRRFRQEFRAALLDPRIDVVLLDAAKGGASGGLGQVFSWELAAAVTTPILQEARQQRGGILPRLCVAGGLAAENVGGVEARLQPWGVDVVSGVEAGPGRKSPDRLRGFLAAAKGQRP